MTAAGGPSRSETDSCHSYRSLSKTTAVWPSPSLRRDHGELLSARVPGHDARLTLHSTSGASSSYPGFPPWSSAIRSEPPPGIGPGTCGLQNTGPCDVRRARSVSANPQSEVEGASRWHGFERSAVGERKLRLSRCRRTKAKDDRLRRTDNAGRRGLLGGAVADLLEDRCRGGGDFPIEARRRIPGKADRERVADRQVDCPPLILLCDIDATRLRC